ncbi:MAG: hypothetical protein CLLPBCKN_007221 [Chroococcidiopsis cubana SAG 39.79]|uniref:Uncharacterized protein n=1 Tax=Chroococcidiopsis cubana SAG 39.79 TaxID=388085 RepID=A0AB37US17_9CYAN|nr:TrbI/VirB10 family protein [Chroococcidiopsis cubana]MDZ4877786.1 hypothetical protein [Chroococcidiopsis cubana SAG 39.79]PSB66620.1 hypothetical protein C7B79_00185 [Chroococcidiopsis cubana CCALA 043]PSB66647.1 hypothetical protein C7B79_00320 [Chroococcidiopsis cubana CCALA 043]RUT14066.1 hypothetical protein DSM107010_05490 [Chroococcidiopsis cubana SAG 39.79]
MDKSKIDEELGYQHDEQAVATASMDEVPLLDAGDRIKPAQVKRQRSFGNKPLPRLILIGTGSFLAMLVVVGFIKGDTNSGGTSQQQPATTNTPPQQESDLAAENAKLKRQLALASQKQQLANLRAQLAKPKPIVTPPSPRLSRIASTRPITASPVRQVMYVPAPKPVITHSQPARPQPATPVPDATPSPDPYQAWSQAATLGRIGSTSATDTSESTSQMQASKIDNSDELNLEGEANISASQPSGGIGEPPSQLTPQAQSPQSSDLSSGNYSNTSPSLIVGTHAAGELETAIAWTGELQNADQRFLIQLKEPLQANDGSIAVPQATKLVARIDSATGNGLLQLSAISQLLQVNGRVVEQPLPPGAILIFSEDGQPLQAKARRRRDLGRDILMPVLAGASNVAGLINSPTSESVYSSGDFYNSTIRRDRRDYLAGFGQGASQSLVSQIQNRNQRLSQDTQSQAPVYQLKQGTSVQIFVNQSFPFER